MCECVHVDHCVLFCSPPLYLFLLIGDICDKKSYVVSIQHSMLDVLYIILAPSIYFWTKRTNELVSWYPPPGGGES